MFNTPLKSVIGTPRLPVSRPTARRLIKDGILKAARLGRHIYIDEESLDGLMDRLAAKSLHAEASA